MKLLGQKVKVITRSEDGVLNKEEIGVLEIKTNLFIYLLKKYLLRKPVYRYRLRKGSSYTPVYATKLNKWAYIGSGIKEKIILKV